MGCCCSTEDNSSVQDETNPRTRLLQDPVNSYHINQAVSEYGPSYGNGNSVPQKSNDHSALYEVLQQTAKKVIDIGALDCQALEEHEYVERSKIYAQSINKICIPQKLLKKKSPMLLMDAPITDKMLTGPPISVADYNLMVSSSKRILEDLNAMRVVHKENLVVPFGKG